MEQLPCENTCARDETSSDASSTKPPTKRGRPSHHYNHLPTMTPEERRLSINEGMRFRKTISNKLRAELEEARQTIRELELKISGLRTTHHLEVGKLNAKIVHLTSILHPALLPGENEF
jgi:hypothetical protein